MGADGHHTITKTYPGVEASPVYTQAYSEQNSKKAATRWCYLTVTAITLLLLLVAVFLLLILQRPASLSKKGTKSDNTKLATTVKPPRTQLEAPKLLNQPTPAEENKEDVPRKRKHTAMSGHPKLLLVLLRHPRNGDKNGHPPRGYHTYYMHHQRSHPIYWRILKPHLNPATHRVTFIPLESKKEQHSPYMKRHAEAQSNSIYHHRVTNSVPSPLRRSDGHPFYGMGHRFPPMGHPTHELTHTYHSLLPPKQLSTKEIHPGNHEDHSAISMEHREFRGFRDGHFMHPLHPGYKMHHNGHHIQSRDMHFYRPYYHHGLPLIYHHYNERHRPNNAAQFKHNPLKNAPDRDENQRTHTEKSVKNGGQTGGPGLPSADEEDKHPATHHQVATNKHSRP